MNIHFTNISIKKIMKISSILILILIGTTMLLNQSCSSASYSTDDERSNKIINSPQYKDGVFFNENGTHDFSFFKMFPMMWDFLVTGNDRKPDVILPTQQVDFDQILNAEPDELKVTWIGHSSFAKYSPTVSVSHCW